MKVFFGAIAALLLIFMAEASAAILFAQAFELCGPGGGPPPTSSDQCSPTTLDAIDPQGRDIWIRAVIDAPPAEISAPAGLFIAAKASSDVYLNGVRLGASGRLASSREEETPGRMDAVFAIPDGLLQPGPNWVAVRFSSHHGYLTLARPVHWIAIAPYAEPAAERLKDTWPSLVALGVILSGALYFAVIAATGAGRRDPILLSLLALFAAGQLVAEMVRSLVAYPYPFHDLRLIAIVVTSAGFGLTLAALVISRFIERAKLKVFTVVAVLIAATIVLAEGFDAKAAFAILAASAASALIAARAALRGDRQGVVFSIPLAVFTAAILIFQGIFLDAIFFFAVAALLLVLFAAQALALERERRERALEKARTHELEAALQRAAEPDKPASIRINGAGSVTIVRAAEITHCSGAGDYVELHLADGRQILHNGALAQLEAELPATFLRVHRSYIVNTDFVKSLMRETSGVGALILSSGAEVPVSRRIMPKVRDALA